MGNSRLTLLLVLGTAVATSAWLGWICSRSSDIAFLTRSGPAEWIVYPVPSSLLARDAVELSTVFRRSFSLEKAPSAGLLQVRALRRCVVTLNRTSIAFPEDNDPNWKQPSRCDVSKHLQVGRNELSVTVSNRSGPPALWLSLTTGDWSLNSDTDWEASLAGAVWQPARMASAPIGGSNLLPEKTTQSFLRKLPTLGLLAALAAGILGAVHLGTRRQTAPSEPAEQKLLPLHIAAALAGVAILWIVLFWNNLGSLYRTVGFDAADHLEYIEYLLDQKALPLASDGWEMYQPPLYYMVSAMVLGAFGLSTFDDTGVTLLRLLGLTAGIAQFTLVFASLRLIFPNQPLRQWGGLILAAFLPMHLYLFHYVTNETLAATLVSATVYLCLRILRDEQPSLAG